MLNRVELIGNLGANPTLNVTTGRGTPVCNFRLATNETWYDESGKKQQRTEWHRIVIYGRAAEVCNTYLRKGSLVRVEGKLQTRKWTDEKDVVHCVTEIVGATNKPVHFLKNCNGSAEVDVEEIDENEELAGEVDRDLRQYTTY